MKKTILLLSLTILVCCIAAVGVYLIWGPRIVDTLKHTTLSGMLVPGNIYTVQLKSAEIPAKYMNKSRWDIDGSAPDCYYQIWWRGNKIAESPVVANSLLPHWGRPDNNISNILNTGKGSAKIKVNPNDFIVIKIFDADPLKSDDEVLSTEIPVKKLLQGSNFIKQGNVSFVLNIVEYEDNDK